MIQTNLNKALTPTFYIDSDHPLVKDFVNQNTREDASQFDNTIQLYYAVRDDFRYDPYSISYEKADFKASRVIEEKRGWCVTKSILYAACCRAIGVPALLGYADVKNHLSTEKMRKTMQTDVFYWHGYTSVYLEGKWVKATTAFNLSLCEKFGLQPLEFNGREDSIYHPFDLKGNQHMEYLNERGNYEDLPFEEMMSDFSDYYPNMGKSANQEDDFDKEVEQEVSKINQS